MTMRSCCLLLLLAVFSLAASRALANGPAEPRFPPSCTVLTAGSLTQIPLQTALDKCGKGEAVELAPGPITGEDSFTIDPIVIPPNVSLIVDGGVTVFGTTVAAKYQTDPPSGYTKAEWVCGKVDFYTKGDLMPCKALIVMSSGSGIYGYGIIDGQGGAQIQQEDGTMGPSWWALINEKTTSCPQPADPPKGASCLEGSPHMITTGTDAAPASNVTMYKITLRDPPMEAVTVKTGSTDWGATLWGVKISAPWNRGNTGALNLSGSNMLVKDNVLSVGDQDIAMEGSVGASTAVTSNIDIEGLRVYSRAGVALLDAGHGFSNVTVNNYAQTGDVPSFVSGANPSVNGVPAAVIEKSVSSIYNALPGSVGDTAGLQLFTGTIGSDPHTAENVTFSNACITDVATPVNMQIAQPGQGSGTSGGPNTGKIGPIYFRNIHVLTPGPQFVMRAHNGGDWVARLYEFEMVGNTVNKNSNQITLNNFVFGSGEAASKLLGMTEVENNIFDIRNNVYPALFNNMVAANNNSLWTFSNNIYLARAPLTLPVLALPCPKFLFPFLTGALYVNLHGDVSGANANLAGAKVVRSSLVTLNAVVEPVMTQTELFIPNASDPANSTLEVPSPALKGNVLFYDNGRYIGASRLGGNGTLASLRINSIGAGLHVYSAEYVDPVNAVFYRPYAFGLVPVLARN